jgi:hypothetical protein
MMAPDRWEMLEMIGAYAASELPPKWPGKSSG